MEKRVLILTLLLSAAFSLNASAAEKSFIEEKAKETSPLKGIKEKLSLISYYEYSWIKIGQRKGDWKLLTETLSYRVNDSFMPYLEINAWERFGEKDYTHNLGAYFISKDNSAYARAEIGFGQDIDYIYKFQSKLDYGHRAFKDLFWELDSRYLNYPDNDVYIASPGVIYYFNDNYLSLFYNVSFTESRGKSQSGMIKGDFKINERLSFWAGAAIGERLYDIEVLPANKQYGYIFFSGLEFKIHKNLKVRLGGSYSKEGNNFFKRSAESSLILKF